MSTWKAGKRSSVVRLWPAWVFAAVFIVGSLGAQPFVGTASGAETQKVSYALDWIIYGKHAGYFAALDKGYYREVGLDVEIVRGYGSGDTIKRVAAGTNDYGLADFGSLVIARSRGAKAKLISMFHHRNLHTLLTLKGSGIAKPKDLEGKSLGRAKGGAVSTIFPALAAANKIDVSKINIVNMSPSAQIASLVAGRVDAILDMFLTEMPTAEDVAGKAGKELVSLPFNKWGVDIYSNGLVASDATISDRAVLTRKFVQASMKGLNWSVENPAEAVGLFVKRHPAISPKLARAHWEIAVDNLLTPLTRQTGFGYMVREKVVETVALMTRLMKLKEVSPDDLYTNGFIAGPFPNRGK